MTILVIVAILGMSQRKYLSRIEGDNHIDNKVKHNEYLWLNPRVAKNYEFVQYWNL